MTDLYSLRSTDTPSIFRVTKFTSDLDAVSSYLIGPEGCECPGYSGRGFCRHSDIVKAIQASDRVDTSWFLETDAKGKAIGWRQYVGPFEVEAPGHTDLMVSPESINDFIPFEDHHLASELDPAPAFPMFQCPTCERDLAIEPHKADCTRAPDGPAPSDLSSLRSRLR